MTAIDWIIVGFTLAMAFWGYSQGLIVGALSLAGFAGGAVLGARIAPLLLDEGAKSPYAPLVTLICAAVIGGIFASGLEVLGFRLRRRIGRRAGVLDGIGGAVLLVCLALGIAWIAGDGVVVTNAHVVSGQDDTTVQLEGAGPEHDADVVWFDVTNDIAILRSSGVSGAPALPLNAGADSGTSAAILGFPENGSYDVQPGRLGPTVSANTQDAYGRGPVRRRITTLRGLVRHGNSGGPVVDGRGRVVTTVFASAASGSSKEGYGVPDGLVRSALDKAEGPVDTGPCVR